jgi:thiamine-phosphate pyrophosphorylase
MPKRHSPHLPRLWLMTDPRLDGDMLAAIARLPKGSGVIFRHYHLPSRQRRALFRVVRQTTRRKRLVLLLADSAQKARAWGADGSHGRHRGATTAPVHSHTELINAQRSGARAVIVSPIFPTRSHPGARALGRVRFGFLVRNARLPVISLGGMNPKRARSLACFGVHGWAGIDAFNSQKRKAVPT